MRFFFSFLLFPLAACALGSYGTGQQSFELIANGVATQFGDGQSKIVVGTTSTDGTFQAQPIFLSDYFGGGGNAGFASVTADEYIYRVYSYSTNQNLIVTGAGDLDVNGQYVDVGFNSAWQSEEWDNVADTACVIKWTSAVGGDDEWDFFFPLPTSPIGAGALYASPNNLTGDYFQGSGAAPVPTVTVLPVVTTNVSYVTNASSDIGKVKFPISSPNGNIFLPDDNSPAFINSPLGVGMTSTPQYQLDVNGTIGNSSSSDGSVNIQNATLGVLAGNPFYTIFANGAAYAANNQNYSFIADGNGDTYFNGANILYFRIANSINPLIITASGVGFGNNISPAYQIDCIGDINTSTKYRVDGTPGATEDLNVQTNSGGHGYTLHFSGGIYTGHTAY